MTDSILLYPYPFDWVFYRQNYNDLDNVIDVEKHFLEIGFSERRYASDLHLQVDMQTIKQSGTFDFEYYQSNYGVTTEQIRHYLLSWQFLKTKPNAQFDDEFVRHYYYRTLAPGENPFVFFSRHMCMEWCFPSLSAAEAAIGQGRHSEFYSSDSDRRCISAGIYVDPYLYYCTEGFRALEPASKRFDTRAYMLQYPDIAIACINPLLHYINHGLKEGRIAFPRTRSVRLAGRKFDKKKKTVLIVSHEASRSGAPIVGINLARYLIEDYNIVSLLLRAGPLLDDFLSVSNEVVVSGDQIGDIVSALATTCASHNITSAILNSAECSKCISFLIDYSIPIVSLIHEFAQYMWTLNLLEKALVLSDAVVFPAEIVKAEALKEFARIGMVPAHPMNLHVRSQGRSKLPPHEVENDNRSLELLRTLLTESDRPFVVLGAGYVQPRKGVDLFIEAARITKHELKTPCLFVWVGANFRPSEDMVVSVYLADQVEQSDLADTILFIDELATLDCLWPLVDAFFLSSRLDPFPNVALDALAMNVPVVCFKSATGIAELASRWPDRVSAPRYGDTRGAAEALLQMGKKKRGPIPTDLEKLLSFSGYAAFISSVMDSAVNRITEKKKMGRSLRQAGFDSDLFNASAPTWLKQPGLGVSADASGRAGVAITAALNGLNVGVLNTGCSAVYDVNRKDDNPWSVGKYNIVGSGQQLRVGYKYTAIIFTNNERLVRQLAKVLFLMPYAKDITIISTILAAGELASSTGLMQNSGFELLQISLKENAELIADKLIAKYKDASCLHLVVDDAVGACAGLSKWEPDHWMATAKSAAKALINDLQLQSVFAHADPLGQSRCAGLSLRSDAVRGADFLVERMISPDQLWIRPSNAKLGQLLSDICRSYLKLGDGRRLFHRVCGSDYAVSLLSKWTIIDLTETVHIPHIDLNFGRLPTTNLAEIEDKVGTQQSIYNGRNGLRGPAGYILSELELKNIELLTPIVDGLGWNIVDVPAGSSRALVHPIKSEPTIAILRGLSIPGIVSLSARVQVDHKEANDVEFGLAAVHRRMKYDKPSGLITQWHRLGPGEKHDIDGTIEIIDDSAVDILLAARMFNDADPQCAWAYFSDIKLSF